MFGTGRTPVLAARAIAVLAAQADTHAALK
jgi:hypothetical protein